MLSKPTHPATITKEKKDFFFQSENEAEEPDYAVKNMRRWVRASVTIVKDQHYQVTVAHSRGTQGCVCIKDLIRKNKIEIEKVNNIMVSNS